MKRAHLHSCAQKEHDETVAEYVGLVKLPSQCWGLRVNMNDSSHSMRIEEAGPRLNGAAAMSRSD